MCGRSAETPAARGIDDAGRPAPGGAPRSGVGIRLQFDVTDDGRAVKLLYVVDEFTRGALAMEAERRIDGDKSSSARPDLRRARDPAGVRSL